MSGEFVVQLTCCGRYDGIYRSANWYEADDFRESYLSGPGVGGKGHQRSAIIRYEKLDVQHDQDFSI